MQYNVFTRTIVVAIAWICSGVYSLLGDIMSGYIVLASDAFDYFNVDSLYDDFARRLYIIIGLFSLFKLSFSLINSVLEPDKFSDKENGFGKLIQRTVISLILIILMPNIFEIAINAQSKIISAIPQIILGSEMDSTQMGEAIAAISYKSFITPNPQCADNPLAENWESTNYDVKSLTNLVSQKCPSAASEFTFEYNAFFSLIAGIVLVVIMFLMSFDVSLRLFKLLVLIVIAPLPLISYIDPKSSKDGMFASWSKLTIKTYLSVFIQLSIVYFVLALLTMALQKI